MQSIINQYLQCQCCFAIPSWPPRAPLPSTNSLDSTELALEPLVTIIALQSLLSNDFIHCYATVAVQCPIKATSGPTLANQQILGFHCFDPIATTQSSYAIVATPSLLRNRILAKESYRATPGPHLPFGKSLDAIALGPLLFMHSLIIQSPLLRNLYHAFLAVQSHGAIQPDVFVDEAGL